MKTGEMGERDFLSKISSFVDKPDGAVLGFDDDASDIPIPEKSNLVINVDTFVCKTPEEAVAWCEEQHARAAREASEALSEQPAAPGLPELPGRST